jgi:hypothetical protein
MGGNHTKGPTIESALTDIATEVKRIWEELGEYSRARTIEYEALTALCDPKAAVDPLREIHFRAAAEAIAYLDSEIASCHRRLRDATSRREWIGKARGFAADDAILDLVTRKMSRISAEAHMERTRAFEVKSAALSLTADVLAGDDEGETVAARADVLYTKIVAAAAAAPTAAALAELVRLQAPATAPFAELLVEPAAVRHRGGGGGGGGGGV